ncbi:MAG: hypothetical protein J6U64_01810 [Alphaproteobacteria bacterium]|nr:hypothetical protein [Alphaproteobacteria bacterium]
MANSLLQPVLDAVNAYRQDQESLEQLVHIASQQLGEDWLNALQTLPDSISVDPEQKANMEAKIGHAVQYYNALTAWQMAEGFINAQTPDISAIEENLPAMEYWLSSFGDAGVNLLNQVKALVPAVPVQETAPTGLPTPADGYDEAMNSLMADLKEYDMASAPSSVPDAEEEILLDEGPVVNESPMIDEVPLDEALDEAYATRTEPIGVPQQALAEEQIFAPEVVAQDRLEAVQAQDIAEEQELAAEVLEQAPIQENVTEQQNTENVDFSDIDFSIFEDFAVQSDELPSTAPDIMPMQENVSEGVSGEDALSSYVPAQEMAQVQEFVPTEGMGAVQEFTPTEETVQMQEFAPTEEIAFASQDETEIPMEMPRTIVSGNPEEVAFVTTEVETQEPVEEISFEIPMEEEIVFPTVSEDVVSTPVAVQTSSTPDEFAVAEPAVAVTESVVAETPVVETNPEEKVYQKPPYAEEGLSYDIPFEVAHFLRERALYEGMDAWIGSRCVNLNKIEKTEYPYYGVLVDLMQSVVKDCDELLARTDLGTSVEMWIAGGRRELTRLRTALTELIAAQEDMYKTSLEDLLDPEKMREVLGKLDLSNRKEKREPAPDGFELVDDPFSSDSTAEMEAKFKSEVGSAIG